MDVRLIGQMGGNAPKGRLVELLLMFGLGSFMGAMVSGILVFAMAEASVVSTVVVAALLAVALFYFIVQKLGGERSEAFTTAIGLFLGACSIAAVMHFKYELPAKQKAEISAEEFERLAVIENGALAKQFRSWRETTVDGGVALKWSGETAEIIWAQPVVGHLRLWALSPGGQYFFVECRLFESALASRNVGGPSMDLTFDGPHVQTQRQVVEALVKGGRADLVKKWNLPERAA